MRTLKRRRVKRPSETGELFQIVQGNTVLAERTLQSEGAAVGLAQNLLSRLYLDGGGVEEPVKYSVRLSPVIGPPDVLYHVVLRPDGVLLTYPAGALRD